MNTMIRRFGHPLFAVLALAWISFEVVGLMRESRSIVGQSLSDFFTGTRSTTPGQSTPPVFITRDQSRFAAVDIESESADELLRAQDRIDPPFVISVHSIPSRHMLRPVFARVRLETVTRSIVDSRPVILSESDLERVKESASEALKNSGHLYDAELLSAEANAVRTEFRLRGLLYNTLTLTAIAIATLQLWSFPKWLGARRENRYRAKLSRGECPTCGYHKGDRITCPECGHDAS